MSEHDIPFLSDPAVDIHTHRTDAGPHAVVNIDPCEYAELPDGPAMMSVGVHPWNSAVVTPEILGRLSRMAEDPRVVAIGETGLDSLRGAPLERQQELFDQHVELSERLGKPLIIHCVRRMQQVMETRRRLRPVRRWILHGFRGNAATARQWLSHGIDLSLGERFDPEAARIIPSDRLHFETDVSLIPVGEIRSRVEAARRQASL